jgi:hypothetical protein
MFTHQIFTQTQPHFTTSVMDENSMSDVKEATAGPARESALKHPRDEKRVDDDEDSGQKSTKRQKRTETERWIFYCENKTALKALRDDCKLLPDIAAMIVEYTPIKEYDVNKQCNRINCCHMCHIDSPNMDLKEFGQARTLLAAHLASSMEFALSCWFGEGTATIRYSIRKIDGKWAIIETGVYSTKFGVIGRSFAICPVCTAYTCDMLQYPKADGHLCNCENSQQMMPVAGDQQVQGEFFRLPSAEDMRGLMANTERIRKFSYTITCEWDDVAPMTE